MAASRSVLLSLAVLATLSRCAQGWTYGAQKDWEQFGQCGALGTQSPIDLDLGAAKEFSETPDLKFNVPSDLKTTNPVTLVTNDHTWEVVYLAGGPNPLPSLTWLGTNYALEQFNFHSPSEHTVDGKHASMEVHFVHKALEPVPGMPQSLVVAVLLNVGNTDAGGDFGDDATDYLNQKVKWSSGVASESKSWTSLNAAEQQGAVILGWTQSTWDASKASPGTVQVPPSEMKGWAQLTVAEQEGATSLGWTLATWDVDQAMVLGKELWNSFPPSQTVGIQTQIPSPYPAFVKHTVDEVLVDGARDFVQYMGSKTTPPCTTDTVWIVMLKKKTITEGQLSNYRSGINSVVGNVLSQTSWSPTPNNQEVGQWNSQLGTNNRMVQAKGTRVMYMDGVNPNQVVKDAREWRWIILASIGVIFCCVLVAFMVFCHRVEKPPVTRTVKFAPKAARVAPMPRIITVPTPVVQSYTYQTVAPAPSHGPMVYAEAPTPTVSRPSSVQSLGTMTSTAPLLTQQRNMMR